MSKPMVARRATPKAKSTPLTAIPYLRADTVHFHAARIRAAAEILDDLDRGEAFEGRGRDELKQDVLRDAITLLLLEDGRKIETESRQALRGKHSPGWTVTAPPRQRGAPGGGA